SNGNGASCTAGSASISASRPAWRPARKIAYCGSRTPPAEDSTICTSACCHKGRPTMSELTAGLARKILNQMGENGKPPELGVSHINVGNESYLALLEKVYVDDLIARADGSSFKLVQGTYGAGKTHFLYCVRDLAWRHDLLCAFVTISPKET